MTAEKIRIGTRGSKLALVQAGIVKKALETAHPGLAARLVTIARGAYEYVVCDLPHAWTGWTGSVLRASDSPAQRDEHSRAASGCIRPSGKPQEFVASGTSSLSARRAARVTTAVTATVASSPRIKTAQ